MEKYNIHSDFLKYKNNMSPPMSPAVIPIINFFMSRLLNKVSPPNGLIEREHSITGYQGAEIKISVIEHTSQDSPMPCLIYFHGGAFVFQAAAYHKRLAFDYAIQTPCKVVFVDYRLEAFPVGLEDCYSAFCWVREHAESLGIDISRIAVGGDSAGGALAAGVCLLARDRNIPMPCFQMLIYPVTDQRQTSDSMKEFNDTPLWNSKLNDKMWRIYLKGSLPEKREYASPAEAVSLEGMPPSYVEVAEYDCLRDEGIAFAEALKRSGVATALYKTKGTIHGFEIAGDTEIVRKSVTMRVKQLQTAFSIE